MKTLREIATNRELWNEYCDPGNNDPEGFDNMTTDDKIAMMVDLWPGDVSEFDEEGQAILQAKRSTK